MSEHDLLERVEEAPSISAAFQETQHANSGKKGPVCDDAKANAYLMDMRAWVDRFNMLGGGYKDSLFGLKGAKLGSLEQGVHFASSALKAAFNYQNPMVILQSVFNMGMVAWKIGLERRNLDNFAAKVNGMGGGILAHNVIGINMFNNRDEAPRWSDGTEVKFDGFENAIKQLRAPDAQIVPEGYTPPPGTVIPAFNK